MTVPVMLAIAMRRIGGGELLVVDASLLVTEPPEHSYGHTECPVQDRLSSVSHTTDARSPVCCARTFP
ncbi:hypothetical protein GCM10023204_07250 [Actinomycetospora succinea]